MSDGSADPTVDGDAALIPRLSLQDGRTDGSGRRRRQRQGSQGTLGPGGRGPNSEQHLVVNLTEHRRSQLSS